MSTVNTDSEIIEFLKKEIMNLNALLESEMHYASSLNDRVEKLIKEKEELEKAFKLLKNEYVSLKQETDELHQRCITENK